MNQSSYPDEPTPDQPAAEEASQKDDAAAQHPHDPFANEAASAPQQPTAPFASAETGTGTPGAEQTEPSTDGPQPSTGYAQPSGHSFDTHPPTIQGVYDGPLPGEPVSDSDARLWSMFAHLAVVLGHVMSWGFLGWVGPLIIFLMYKDRNRFVRYNAAEALNGAIAVVIAQVVLSIVMGIFGIITLGFGFMLFPLVGLPALVQLIFAIIGAVKANQGEWWNYPLNIRFVK